MAVFGVTTPIANWIAGAANPNKFMLSGGNFGDGYVYTSPTGLPGTWAQAGYIGFPGVLDATGWGSSFVIVGPGGGSDPAATYSSDNGDTWASGDLDMSPAWEGVVANDDGSIIVAVGTAAGDGCSARSTDGGATWSPTDATQFGTGVFMSKVAWNGSVFLAVAYSGELFTSPTGVTWTPAGSTGSTNLWDAIGSIIDGRFVLVGGGGTGPGIWVSMDNGATWTEATTYPAGFTQTIERVTGCDGTYLVIEDNGASYSTSVDGLDWAAPITCPDNPGLATFFDDAECHRSDSCLRASKFYDYALLFQGTVTPAATASPFFHFTFAAG